MLSLCIGLGGRFGLIMIRTDDLDRVGACGDVLATAAPRPAVDVRFGGAKFGPSQRPCGTRSRRHGAALAGLVGPGTCSTGPGLLAAVNLRCVAYRMRTAREPYRRPNHAHPTNSEYVLP